MKKCVWTVAFAAAGGVLSVYGYSDKLPATTGTNVWIGAASGGNWSDAANWKCESATYTDPRVRSTRRAGRSMRRVRTRSTCMASSSLRTAGSRSRCPAAVR